MFNEFFENKQPLNSGAVSSERVNKIKAAVLNELNESEDKPMKKINIARPFIIAAAIAALGAGSLVSANIATDGDLLSDIAMDDEELTNIIKDSDLINKYVVWVPVKINGEDLEMEGEQRIYEKDGEKIYEYSFEVGEDIEGNAFSIDFEFGHEGDFE